MTKRQPTETTTQMVMAEAELHTQVYLDLVAQNLINAGIQERLPRVGLYFPSISEAIMMWAIGREVDPKHTEGFWFVGTAVAHELDRQLGWGDRTGITSHLLPAVKSVNGMIGLMRHDSVYVRPDLNPNLIALVVSDAGLICSTMGGIAVIN